MSLFNTKTFTVTRKAAGSYSETTGRWVDGTSSTFSASGSLQPASGNKVQALMEGKRLQAIYDFFTATELRAADPVTQTIGDIVTISGQNYEVQLVEPWQNGIISHYVATLSRYKEVSEASS